jgi:hypothetical protein
MNITFSFSIFTDTQLNIWEFCIEKYDILQLNYILGHFGHTLLKVQICPLLWPQTSSIEHHWVNSVLIFVPVTVVNMGNDSLCENQS